MSEEEKIAKSMEGYFKKERVRCPKCKKGSIKFDTIMIDNVNIGPVRGTCRKCGFWFLEPVTTSAAMREVKISYGAQSKKVKKVIIDFLKNLKYNLNISTINRAIKIMNHPFKTITAIVSNTICNKYPI